MNLVTREYERSYTIFYLHIFEGKKFIGYLDDISREGFMMITHKPLKVGKVYHLRLKLPSVYNSQHGNRAIYEAFGAKCMWSHWDESVNDLYINGFHFEHLPDGMNSKLTRLIEDYSSLD